jgi:hypothetical protein
VSKGRKADIFPFTPNRFNYIHRAQPLRNSLRSYRAISSVNVELKNNVSDIFSFSIIRVDVVNDHIYWVEGTTSARRIITPPEFVQSSCENIVESSSTFSCCENCNTSTNYECHLETIEVCLSRLQDLE